MPHGELRGQIIAALRQRHAKRMPRARGTAGKRSNIADPVPLSPPPAQADSRQVPGHWAGDFVKGKSKVRQFLPKGTDLSTVTPQKLACIDSRLNDRPRRILGLRTPREVCTALVQNQLAMRNANHRQPAALQA